MLKPFSCPYLSRGVKIVDEGQMYPCCDYDKREGAIPGTNLSDYFASNNLAILNSKFAAGEWPKGCVSCWASEAQGIVSHRQQALKNYDLLNFDRRYVELSIGNQCNSDCVMCYPLQSSKIARRVKIHGLAPGVLPEKTVKNHWMDDPTWWEDFATNIDTVGNISILGGEPFLNKRIWAHLNDPRITAARDRITLQVTTNGSKMRRDIVDSLMGWKTLILNVSVDATGEQYEWIRQGLSWATLNKNFSAYQKIPNAILSVSFTAGVYSLTGLPALLRWIDSKNVIANHIHINWPANQRLRYAPPDVLQTTLDEIRALELNDMNQPARANLEADIVFAISHNQYNPEALAASTNYYNGHRTGKMCSRTLRIINEQV